MADNQETTQTLNLLVTGGDHGAGLVLAREAVKHGHNVFAASTRGTFGAKRIRSVGAFPVYPELERSNSLRSAILLAKADVVVHCAPQDFISLPQHRIDYAKTAHLWEESTEALVAAAGQSGVKRLIHLSAAYLYGETHRPATESAEIDRSNKLFNHGAEAEEAIFDGGIPGYVVRSGFIYGGWHDAMMALNDDLRSGRGVAKGDGQAAWIYEDDLALALLKLAEHQPESEAMANVFNIADDEPMTHNAFMNLFGKLVGVGEPNNINPLLFPLRTNEIQLELLAQSTQIDTSKAQNELGWTPQTATKEAGIEKSMVVWRALDAPEDALPSGDSGKELTIR